MADVIPPLSQEIQDWIQSAHDDDSRTVVRFMAGVPAEWMRTALFRDAYRRHVFACTGRAPPQSAGCDLIHMRDIGKYRNLVPAEDSNRIRLFARAINDTLPHADTGDNASAEFVRYAYDMLQGTAAPCPLVHNRDIDSVRTNGTVIAGGSVLSDIMLPASSQTPAQVTVITAPQSADPDDVDLEVRTYMLKGPRTDLDTFLIVDAGSNTPLLHARKVAKEAMACIDTLRFSPNAVCDMCTVPIRIGDYVSCMDTHTFHMECAPDRDSTCCRCDEAGVMSPLRKVMMNYDRFRVTGSRTTINANIPDIRDGAQRATPLVQITSRVYSDMHHVVAGFDLPLSQVVFDGTDVWLTELAAICIANRVQIVTPFTMSGTGELRLLKYAHRYGLDLFVPGVGQAAFDNIAASSLPYRGIVGIRWLRDRIQEDITCKVSFRPSFSQSLTFWWSKFRFNIAAATRIIAGHTSGGLSDSMRARLMLPTMVGHLIPVTSILDDCVKEDDAAQAVLENATGIPDIAVMSRTALCRITDEHMVAAGCSRAVRCYAARVATGNALNLSDAELVDMLHFKVILPGEQTFCHAHVRKMNHGRTDAYVSALAFMDIWRPESLLG